MSYFYTSVEQQGNFILYRGYRDGKQFFNKEKFKPELFIPTKKESRFKSIKDIPLEPIQFDSCKEARDFIKRYKDVNNFTCYGMEKWITQFMIKEWPRVIDYDNNLIKICYIDIETKITGEDGKKSFPDLKTADKEITAISFIVNGKTYLLGMKDFKAPDHVTYYKCSDEKSLLKNFITFMVKIRPDVISGWNSEGFDIPYIIRRSFKILGEEETKNISPWKIIKEKTVPTQRGIDLDTYDIGGIASLDYMMLYKRYEEKLENYRLETVAQHILKVGKLDYSEYEDLDDLYERNPQLYYNYNIRDSELLPQLEEKLKLLKLVFMISYLSKVNYIDTFKNTRIWDSLIYDFLKQRNTIVDISGNIDTDDSNDNIAGGYVKFPKGGMYDWVVTYDATSLYPSVIMSCNISPETFVEKIDLDYNDILNSNKNKLKQYLHENNLVLCGNGSVFRRDKEGFLPQLMRQLFDNRKNIKNEMLEKEREIERISDKNIKKNLKETVNMLDVYQKAVKTIANSGFGFMASDGSRYCHSNFSEAITLTGQLCIQWAQKYMNLFLNKYLNSTTLIDYVTYGDTDSIATNFGDIIKKSKLDKTPEIIEYLDNFGKTKIQPFLSNVFDKLGDEMNFYKQQIFFKREKICDKAIFLDMKKKRYILSVWDKEGTRYSEPKVSVTGIEAVRSSTPPIVKDALKEVFKLTMTKTNKEVLNYIESFREVFYNAPIDEISRPMSVNGLSKYSSENSIYSKGTPIHVRGTLLYNHIVKQKQWPLEMIHENDKIKFVYLKMPNPINENVIAFPSELPKRFGLEKYIDRKTQFEKTFIEPLNNVYESIGWKTQDTADLEELFS